MSPAVAGTLGLTPLFPPVHPLGAPLRRIWVFPGQGSQKIGMGRELYDSSSTYRAAFDQGCRALLDRVGVDLRRIVFDETPEELTRTLHAQPALLVSHEAFRQHLAVEEGIVLGADDLLAGHSAGEYNAYVAADSLTLEEGAQAVYWRGRFMEEECPFDPAQPRPMAAVLGLAPEVLEEVCREVSRDGHIVVPANFNSPGQIVISGHPAAVQEASGLLKSRGAKRVVELPVAGSFHSPLMQKVRERLAAKLADLGIVFRRPSHLILSNVTGREIDFDADHLDSLLNQITGAVRWQDEMIRAWELGAIQMVSVDVAGEVLLGLARQIFSSERPVQSIDPRIAMHRQALRAAPGVLRTTVFPPSPRTATERLLEFSYDAGAIAREVRRLLATGEEGDFRTTLRVMDNPYNLARDAGLRELQKHCQRPEGEIPAALRERNLEWPPPIVRDLPITALPPEAETKLRKEIFPALVKQGLAPLDEEALIYYVASRWGGDTAKLTAIMARLERMIGLSAVRLAVFRFGPGDSMQGLSSWDHVVLAVDCHKDVNFSNPGAMKEADIES